MPSTGARRTPARRPGVLAAETAQSIARGADGIMFFQWRQSRAGSEKFHSAMLPHAGTDTAHLARGRRTSARGSAALPTLPAPGRDARVALVFDWENWWAVEERDHPVEIDYLALSLQWYGALHARGLMVDIVPPERVDDGYDLAIAPALYLLRDEGAAALTRFVEGGGTLLTGPFTDVVDEHDQFRAGGFLTQLGPVLGVRFEDFGALGGASTGAGGIGVGAQAAVPRWRRARRHGRTSCSAARRCAGTLVAEVVRGRRRRRSSRPSPTAPAEGSPALTRHAYGEGEAWYVATMPDAAGLDAVVGRRGGGIRSRARRRGAARRGRGRPPRRPRHASSTTATRPSGSTLDGTDAETGAPVGAPGARRPRACCSRSWRPGRSPQMPGGTADAFAAR